MRLRLEAKVAEQQSVIDVQRIEIEDFERKIGDKNEQLRKIEESVVNKNNKIDRLSAEISDLKNKTNELQNLLDQK